MSDAHRLASDLRAAAIAFLASDVFALDAAVAGLLEGVIVGTVEPTTLRAALGGAHRALAPARPGKVALLGVFGLLTAGPSLFTMLGMGTSMRAFMQDLRAAAANPTVEMIAIEVDSPGGSVQLLPEAAALLRQVRTRKPVVALVAGCCCSAAYWLSANTTRIIATHSATLGSIGVIGERVSVARRLASEGVDVTLIATSPAKTWGHPATVLTDAERAFITQRVTELGADFNRDVAAGRRVSLAVVRADDIQGRTFSATEAQRRGLIDAVTLDGIDHALAAEAERPVVAAALAARRTALTHAALAGPRARFTRAALAGPRAALAAAARRGGVHS